MPLGLAQESTLQLTLKAVDNASGAIKDVEQALDSLGAGTTLAGLGAQIGAVEHAITRMAAVAPTVTDMDAGFVAVEAAARDTAAAVKDVETALHGLGRGVSLADLSTQLHTLDATMAGVATEVGALTGEVQHGFKEMADAAHFGTAAITDAIRTAGVEQVEAMRAATREMTDTLRTSLQTQDKDVERSAQHRKNILGKGLDTVKQMAIWGTGYQVFNALTDSVFGFIGGLITVNATLQTNERTFSAIFGSGGAGEQAVKWLDEFARHVPATREEMIQAGLTVATLGDDLNKVIPALSDVAAVMGVDMTRAAQAFADAQLGRFEMLQMTLHVTKQELVNYGLELDNQGHVLNDSFVPAFLKLAQTPQFLGQAEKQVHTFTGALSNIGDNLSRLQELAGASAFRVLEKELNVLNKALDSPTAARWAAGIGDALGHALEAVINFTHWFLTNFGPPIMHFINMLVGAWNMAAPAIQGALHIIEAALSTAAQFVNGPIKKAFFEAIGNIVNWWHDNAGKMDDVFTNLKESAEKFWTSLSDKMKDTVKLLQGVWTIVWGGISGTVAIALDIIHGDLGKAKDDFIEIWKAYAVGTLKIVNSLVDSIIRAFDAMLPGINKVLTFLVQTGARAFGMLGQIVINSLGGLWTNFSNKMLAKAQDFANSPLGFLLGPAADEILHQRPGKAPFLRDVSEAGAAAAAEAPKINLQFDSRQAIAHADELFQGWIDAVHLRMDQHAHDTGKKWWDNFLAELNKHGIKFPKFLDTTSPEQAPGPTGSITAGGDPRTQAREAHRAVTEATARFQVFLEHGAPGGMAAGLKLIADIARADYVEKKSRDETTLDVIRYTKDLLGLMLKRAEDHIQLDKDHHASQADLQRDANSYMAVFAQLPGVTKEQIALERERINKEIKSDPKDVLNLALQQFQDMRTLHMSNAALMAQVGIIMKDYATTGIKPGTLHYKALQQQLIDEVTGGTAGAGYTRPAEPRYMPYGGLGRQPGFGGVEVMFGGPQADPTSRIVAELRYQNEHLREQVKHLQALLHPMQQTASNTGQTARNTSGHTMGHEATYPAPPQPSTAAMRRGGGMVPVPV
jgi:hypothetical protein